MINISQEIKASREAQGVITDDVSMSGDISGTLPAPTVVKIQGKSVPSSGGAEGHGLRIGADGNFEYSTILGENSAFGGDVSGSQAAGLVVVGVDGETFELTSPIDGQVIKRVGGVFVNADDSSSESGLRKVVTSVDVTAEHNDIIFVNTLTNPVAVTAVPSPNDGDFFFVKDSHGGLITNNLTIVGNVEGDAGGAIVSSNNIMLMFNYNGTDWRYTIVDGGH